MRFAFLAGLVLAVMGPVAVQAQPADAPPISAAEPVAPPVAPAETAAPPPTEPAASAPVETSAPAGSAVPELPKIGPNEFLVQPPGVLQDPRAKGVAEYKGYAPGMRFPIGWRQAHINSQVFGIGGRRGPKGDQCDLSNYSGAWWDTYCEDHRKSGAKSMCPIHGATSVGVQIRGGTSEVCKAILSGRKVDVPIRAVYDGVVERGLIMRTGISTFVLRTDSFGDFEYRHISLAPDILQTAEGSRVKAGDTIGFLSIGTGVGNNFENTLHLDLTHWVEEPGKGKVAVPLYCDLILAYEREHGMRHVMVGGGQRCGEAGFSIAVSDEVLTTVSPGTEILLNGIKRSVMEVKLAEKSIMLTGTEDALLDGLNSLKKDLVATGAMYRFFKEKGGQKVEPFADPYGPSHAVIAAIDEYERDNDPQHSGGTGYRRLTGMVDSAEKLKGELIRHGFKPENIVTLYNKKATAEAIQDALLEFHEGGKHETADRVLFYFGGHGDGKDGNGHLITYDFDPKRPTRRSFPMARFVSEHFPFIKAKHMLVALDTCSSGMALQGMFTLDKEKTEADLKGEIVRLATLEGETRDKARNMIVAGTGDQKALWEEEGGLFTKALVEALSGQADFIGDGIIQFDELSLYVTRAVREAAKRRGLQQDPRAFVATGFGQGKVLFLSPERQ